MVQLTLEETRAYIADLVGKSRKAQRYFEHNYKDQRSIDEVVRAVGMGVVSNGEKLAAGAAEETGMGNYQAKLDKLNIIALKEWNYMKGKQTVGYLDVSDEPGVRMMYKPMGVIGCVMPSTNPIATVIANVMMALKGRNSAIIAPHPGSAKASYDTCEAMRKALESFEGLQDLVLCVEPGKASIDATRELLAACDVNIATGGAAMVKSVYSSGKPGFGVGQGNCQSIVDREMPEEFSLDHIVKETIENRSWDYGVPCTGDQTIHIPEELEPKFLALAKKHGAYLIETSEEIDALRELLFPGDGRINRAIVGKEPHVLGELLGWSVPKDATVILLRNQKQGAEDALCREILCPVLRYRTWQTFEEAVEVAVANLENEGAGHSSAIWTSNEEHVAYAADLIPVGRFHVNQCTGGSGNGIPSTMTIGCGSWGNNSISENLQYYHLLNKTRISTRLYNLRPIDPVRDWEDYGPVSPIME